MEHSRKQSCVGYKDFKLSRITLVDLTETMENASEMTIYIKIPKWHILLDSEVVLALFQTGKVFTLLSKWQTQRAGL